MEDKYTLEDIAKYQIVLAENQQAIFDAISDLTKAVNGLGIDLMRVKYEVDDTRSKADEIHFLLEQTSLAG